MSPRTYQLCIEGQIGDEITHVKDEMFIFLYYLNTKNRSYVIVDIQMFYFCFFTGNENIANSVLTRNFKPPGDLSPTSFYLIHIFWSEMTRHR